MPSWLATCCATDCANTRGIALKRAPPILLLRSARARVLRPPFLESQKIMAPSREALEIDRGTSTYMSHAQATAALDLKVARRMFYGGFAGLPWLWFVAWAHFRHVAKSPTADPQLQNYVNRMLYGAICGGVLFIAWVVMVQLNWRAWGWQSIMLVVPEDVDDL